MDYAQFDHLLDCIFVYDEEKKIVYCNEACATMLKTSLKRLKPGKFVYDFLQFEDKDIFFMKDGTMGKESAMKYREIPFTSKSGDTGVGMIMISPLPSLNLWIATVRDMSLEVQLHAKHHQQLAALETLVKELQEAKAQLEDYSQNLEKMVEERTEELRKAHNALDLMINSIGQGLLVFDNTNTCWPGSTKACEEIFGVIPTNKKMWEVLKLNEKQIASFTKWSQCIFSEMLPFNDMVGLGISHLSNNLDHRDPEFKYTALEYFPLRDQQDKLQGIVTVATNKTDEIRAKKSMEEKEAYVSMVNKIINNKKQFISFINDAKNIIREMETGLNHEQIFDYPLLMRLMHSIKGGASLYSIKSIVDLAHQYESELTPFKEQPNQKRQEYLPTLQKNVETIKLKLYEFCNDCKAFIGDVIEDGEDRMEIKASELKDFERLLEKNNRELAHTFNDLFLKEPIIKYFSGYNNLVQELAVKLDKSINPIQFTGEQLKIRPDRYLEFFNVLVHLFRNCVDHGIEQQEIRLNHDKEPNGTISVSFTLQTKNDQQLLLITITDDGAGIDPTKIRTKMIELGKADIVQKETDQQIIYHIFDPSFSTSAQVSEISGRGVGMDAIKETLGKIGGQISLESRLNQGSKFTFSIPYQE